MSGSGYRPDIDGLRAFAIVSVVAFHAGLPIYSGFVGVDIFFVISGFLITGIIDRDIGRGSYGYAEFYARRARRILPALFVVLIATTIASLAILSPNELTELSKSTITVNLAASNLYFYRSIDYFHPVADQLPLMMTWSLGIEEQFYFLFPILLLLLSRFKRTQMLAVVAAFVLLSFVVCILASWKWRPMGFYLLPSRAWELGVGGLLALTKDRISFGIRTANALGIIGIASLVISSIALTNTIYWPSWYAALPVLGTACLIAAPQSIVNRRFLSSRPMVGIGLISYSWYLWHWPLFALLRRSLFEEPGAGTMVGAAIVSFLLAILSWRFVEQPFRKRQLPNAKVLTRYGIAILALSAVSAALIAGHGLPGRFAPQVVHFDDAIRNTHKDPCLVSGGDLNLGAPCTSRAPGRPVMALLGDSHAAALGPGFRALAEKHGWGYVTLTKNSCEPLLGVVKDDLNAPKFAGECSIYASKSINWVADQPDIKTVLLVGRWYIWAPNDRLRFADNAGSAKSPDQILKSGLRRTIERLQAAGKRVIIANQTVTWPFDPTRAAYFHGIPARAAIQHWLEPNAPIPGLEARPAPQEPKVMAALREIVQERHIATIDLRAVFCEKADCRYMNSGTLLFADQSHLTPAGALLALQPSEALLFLAH